MLSLKKLESSVVKGIFWISLVRCQFIFRASTRLKAAVLSCLLRLSLPLGRRASFGSSALAILRTCRGTFLHPRCIQNAAHRKFSRGSTAKLV
ncbi:MAG: hypothetical protein AVDCRST_MAG95-66 [uncultured Adhaeribacter sp.]|uniref:Uncharacterized protein n=1 Tax=uncultured Adhaeribacter sp. TaxID=448109 RepID=A0A6J4H393_9BACT|nr:MAG: hypothetical protein AVDCRST_MAG95-66 [uncultured Adhaeribacter sp.]